MKKIVLVTRHSISFLEADEPVTVVQQEINPNLFNGGVHALQWKYYCQLLVQLPDYHLWQSELKIGLQPHDAGEILC